MIQTYKIIKAMADENNIINFDVLSRLQKLCRTVDNFLLSRADVEFGAEILDDSIKLEIQFSEGYESIVIESEEDIQNIVRSSDKIIIKLCDDGKILIQIYLNK